MIDRHTLPQRRQALHRRAEINALLDTPSFITRARDLYGYPHFVADTGGSICELVDPENPQDEVLSARLAGTIQERPVPMILVDRPGGGNGPGLAAVDRRCVQAGRPGWRLMDDRIDIGVFAGTREDPEVLYLEKHRITDDTEADGDHLVALAPT